MAREVTGAGALVAAAVGAGAVMAWGGNGTAARVELGLGATRGGTPDLARLDSGGRGDAPAASRPGTARGIMRRGGAAAPGLGPPGRPTFTGRCACQGARCGCRGTCCFFPPASDEITRITQKNATSAKKASGTNLSSAARMKDVIVMVSSGSAGVLFVRSTFLPVCFGRAGIPACLSRWGRHSCLSLQVGQAFLPVSSPRVRDVLIPPSGLEGQRFLRIGSGDRNVPTRRFEPDRSVRPTECRARQECPAYHIRARQECPAYRFEPDRNARPTTPRAGQECPAYQTRLTDSGPRSILKLRFTQRQRRGKYLGKDEGDLPLRSRGRLRRRRLRDWRDALHQRLRPWRSPRGRRLRQSLPGLRDNWPGRGFGTSVRRRAWTRVLRRHCPLRGRCPLGKYRFLKRDLLRAGRSDPPPLSRFGRLLDQIDDDPNQLFHGTAKS